MQNLRLWINFLAETSEFVRRSQDLTKHEGCERYEAVFPPYIIFETGYR